MQTPSYQPLKPWRHQEDCIICTTRWWVWGPTRRTGHYCAPITSSAAANGRQSSASKPLPNVRILYMHMPVESRHTVRPSVLSCSALTLTLILTFGRLEIVAPVTSVMRNVLASCEFTVPFCCRVLSPRCDRRTDGQTRPVLGWRHNNWRFFQERIKTNDRRSHPDSR